VKGKLKSMYPTFLLPYLIKEAEKEGGRGVSCALELERAAILCLSETKRKKRGILTGDSEKISCISKLYYPFWTVPWNDKCIIIDGLDLFSSKMRFNEIPDVLRFTEDLNKSSSSLSRFLKVLKRHSKTFQRFKSSREIHLKGVVNKPSMLKSFMTILEDVKNSEEGDLDDAVFVSPIILGDEAEERAQKFINQWNILNSEVDSLHYAIEVLNEETEHHKEKISAEIEGTRRDYELRISRIKRLVGKKVKTFVKEKEKTEGRIERAYGKKMERILKEKNKLKEKVDRLNISLREALKTRKRQKSKYPKRSTTRIDNRIAKYRSEIRLLRGKIAELSKLEEKTRREARMSLKEAEEKYRALISEELEKIDILKESEKLEISEKSELRSRIDRDSSSIESLLRELISEKTKEIDNLESRAVPVEMEETSLLGIPFYLILFESPRRLRFEIYPPMVARSYTGTMQKIRRRFFSFTLESRMDLLLNPRFPEINREIFLNLEKKIKSNSTFKRVILEKARSNNLLKSSGFMKNVEEGLNELQEKGWVSLNERRSISEIYVKS